MRRTLEQTLSTLEAEPREILMLHYFAGKSLREIAAMTGISREAAAKRLQRAREALGEELLKAVPEARPSREVNRVRARAILAAIVAAPVAWRAAPAGPSGFSCQKPASHGKTVPDMQLRASRKHWVRIGNKIRRRLFMN